ncbi:hypothetical protein [Streptomyces sp. NPDC051569]|uniref:hypothetical protein n=1 Tax=Streptomyces sp. NPDC051569 TaxID=3365661 RepID=UPI0037AF636C
MTDNPTRSRSNALIGVTLAVLVCCEVALLSSGASDGVRYGVGAAIAVALVVGVIQLGRTRRTG